MKISGETIATIALEAGALIMDVYNSDFEVDVKSDSTPVTLADGLAESHILKRLHEIEPSLIVVAEEAVSATGSFPEHGERFALVDPLDGTREFVDRNGEFTVNIAIIENGKSVQGVVYAPATGRMFVGDGLDSAWQCVVSPKSDLPPKENWRKLKVRELASEGMTAVASRSHLNAATENYLKKRNVKEVLRAGSSLKFCLIAAGEADIYPRFGRTMEWDTAAGQAVVECAGGNVFREDGSPLFYGKKSVGYENPSFIVSGSVL